MKASYHQTDSLFSRREINQAHQIMLIEELHQNTKNGKQRGVILLDFSKTFDKVNDEKLIYKLHGYGIRNNPLALIKTFFDGR